MRTTVNLDPAAYRLARAVAAQRGVSVGKVLGDALLERFQVPSTSQEAIERDAEGWPILDFGRPITNEDVRLLLEDE